MVDRIEASRELLLGLYALESGAVDREQLVDAVRAWASSPDRVMSEVLGGLDASTIARLEDRVARDLEATPGSPEPTMTYTPTISGRGPGPGSEGGVGGGRYRVVRPHARGGLGEVFLAFDGELNRPVALKELQSRRAHDPDSQDRFLLEAELTGKLEHPGIVPVYSLGRYPDGRPFYAMRFIEGETLRAAIEQFHRASPKGSGAEDRDLAFLRLLGSVIDACNAVAYAHSRGVIHRDLKPENIMLGRFGETLVVDWGMAKSFEDKGLCDDGSEAAEPVDPSMTRPGSVVGTPRYMSPEQAMGDLDRVGPASDIYGLGAILYCLLVGHAPFPDGDLASVLDRVRRGIFPAPRRLRRSVDPRLEAICLKAMATDPGDRQGSALDLANDLEAWRADVRYRGEQELALGQAKGALTRLCLERAHGCLGRKEHAEGMLWLARALENAPAEPPDLQRVIRTSLGGWHAGTKLLVRSFRHDGEVHAVAFCPEGRRLATASGDRAARLWDLSTGSSLAPPLKHEGSVRAVAFHPDGDWIATGSDEGTIRRWDALTGEPRGEPLRHGAPVAWMAFSPDGSRIAAGGPGAFSLWDAIEGKPLCAEASDAGVLAVAFAPDGSTIAIAREDGVVQIRGSATGDPLGQTLNHGSAVRALAFDSTGRRLLAGTADGESRLWDLDRSAPILSITHGGEVHCVGFRPGADSFATASGDGTGRLWDALNGRPIGEPLTHRDRVDRLAFRPDGLMVATGSPDGTVRLWCASTGLPIGPPLEKAGKGRSMAFSPDGRRLATGGVDAVVRCWKVPDPVEGTVERVSCWVSVTTDLEFDEGDAIRRLDGPMSWDLRRRLTELGGHPLPEAR
ncbi:WD40 repeat domain-containing serine/threonine protein kinase [Tundrisphaera lichenicola]|uniref:WD40 repeat domain-containing serine/threonine protein kinase n=1 Tax=Tundrisphaera lichenicola TaxID=2029860 RepID=UPI003EBA0F97